MEVIDLCSVVVASPVFIASKSNTTDLLFASQGLSSLDCPFDGEGYNCFASRQWLALKVQLAAYFVNLEYR